MGICISILQSINLMVLLWFGLGIVVETPQLFGPLCAGARSCNEKPGRQYGGNPHISLVVNIQIFANRGKDKFDRLVSYIVFLLLLYKILRAEACSILKLKILTNGK